MDNWFSKWFASDEYLDVYNHRDENDARQLVSLILENINLPKGSSVLDAACGAGRYLKEFSKAGYKTYGFDLSLPLLKVANKTRNEENLDFELINSDIRYAFYKKKFNLILNLFTSFGYFFDDRQNFSFVNNSYEMINNGYFVFDYLNKNYLLDNLIPESERYLDDKLIIEKREIIENRVVKKLKIKTECGIKEFVESVRLYDKDEIIAGFNNAGYSAENIYGNYSGAEFNRKSERLIIFFKK